jgi:hypothetical protein
MGIMCQGTTFEAWQARCIREVLATGAVELVLLVVDAATPAPSKTTWQKIRELPRNRRAAWSLYHRLFVRGRSRAMQPVDMARELVGVPMVRCVAERRGKWARHFKADEIAEIKKHQLDFVLRFAFNIVKGDILTTPRWGVWSFHHDDLDVHRGQPACFWPLALGDVVQGVTLQRLTEGVDNGVVLARGWFATVRHSYVRNMDRAFLASTGFPAKVCRDLWAGAAAYVEAPPSKTTAPNRTFPDNRQTLLFAGRILWRKIVNVSTWLAHHRQWTVGVVRQPITSILRDGIRDEPEWFRGVPRGAILADPFGLLHDGETTILAEYMDQVRERGEIVALRWPWRPGESPRPIGLPATGHRSYPFLLEADGQIYCVPESRDAHEIAIYRAVEFPSSWERVAAVATGIDAVDASLVRHAGRWWAFTGVIDGEDTVALHAFHGDAITGPWTAHAGNPLKLDVRSTRPGGTPFVHEGRLYRPAQDCRRIYGEKVVINEVTTLTESSFAEEPVATVEAQRGWTYDLGVHTLSSLGASTLVDGQRWVWVPGLFWKQLGRYLRKITARRAV